MDSFKVGNIHNAMVGRLPGKFCILSVFPWDLSWVTTLSMGVLVYSSVHIVHTCKYGI